VRLTIDKREQKGERNHPKKKRKKQQLATHAGVTKITTVYRPSEQSIGHDPTEIQPLAQPVKQMKEKQRLLRCQPAIAGLYCSI
jgi:hypothetical protein